MDSFFLWWFSCIWHTLTNQYHSIRIFFPFWCHTNWYQLCSLFAMNLNISYILVYKFSKQILISVNFNYRSLFHFISWVMFAWKRIPSNNIYLLYATIIIAWSTSDMWSNLLNNCMFWVETELNSMELLVSIRIFPSWNNKKKSDLWTELDDVWECVAMNKPTDILIGNVMIERIWVVLYKINIV